MWTKKGAIRGDYLTYIYSKKHCINQLSSIKTFHSKHLAKSPFPLVTQYSVISSYLNPTARKLKDTDLLAQTQILPSFKFATFYSTKAPSRSFRRRKNKREKANSKPVLDEAKFQQAISELPSRFTNDELCNILTLEDDPLVCLALFNWASQQHRFRHDASTYHVTIKKLGIAKMYQEMDDVVNQLLAVPHIGNEASYNSIIYYFTEARKLTRAVNIFKRMKSSRNLDCRPSIRTYNILLTAMLSRGSNSYVNHMYMETMRCLFKQMADDGIEPDIFSLNSMIKGYVLSLHINDALRVFHQMGVVYKCLPNSFSYDYLVHGLCAQGRTNNAREMFDEMKEKGFVPSNKSYNSFVNALALGGEVEEAVNYLSEMIEKHRSVDLITYRTILDEICRRGRVGEATRLLKEWQEKDLVDGITYRKLLYVLEDDFGNSNDIERFRY
ncbi:unnamed protein product [Dovyalis caffra]|uniref:Pentatricopeptide repeat-containing protein n=1 Tax=Dovyalis caffra TaxID=77055 RepID=A0AAV1RLT2_9ROSI|nr:unnamed protein product [Dovyalis caffra]